jgi:hypothetical protein
MRAKNTSRPSPQRLPGPLEVHSGVGSIDAKRQRAFRLISACVLLLIGGLAPGAGSFGTMALAATPGDVPIAISKAPQIVRRDQWQAKPALPGMMPQQPRAIILHNTGVAQNSKTALETKMRGLQSYSQKPGMVTATLRKPAWPDVPYHFYIDVSGRIAEGRDIGFAGDTNTGYDTENYIQIAVEGDFEVETPLPVQMAALDELLDWLMLSWNIPVERISVHKDHAATDCPGRHFMTLLPELLKHVAARRKREIARTCAQAPPADFAANYCQAR